MQASSSGQITYQEPGADGQPGKEASLDFFAADTHRLRPGRQLPKGTLVEFNICTDNQTKQRRAVHVRPYPAAAFCNALSSLCLSSSSAENVIYPFKKRFVVVQYVRAILMKVGNYFV